MLQVHHKYDIITFKNPTDIVIDDTDEMVYYTHDAQAQITQWYSYNLVEEYESHLQTRSFSKTTWALSITSTILRFQHSLQQTHLRIHSTLFHSVCMTVSWLSLTAQYSLATAQQNHLPLLVIGMTQPTLIMNDHPCHLSLVNITWIHMIFTWMHVILAEMST